MNAPKATAVGYMLITAMLAPKQRRLLRGQTQDIFRPTRIEALEGGQSVVVHPSPEQHHTLSVGDHLFIDVENTTDSRVRVRLKVVGAVPHMRGDAGNVCVGECDC